MKVNAKTSLRRLVLLAGVVLLVAAGLAAGLAGVVVEEAAGFAGGLMIGTVASELSVDVAKAVPVRDRMKTNVAMNPRRMDESPSPPLAL